MSWSPPRMTRRACTNAHLPLESTPVYEVNISDPTAELPELRQQYPDAKNHLVRIRW